MSDAPASEREDATPDTPTDACPDESTYTSPRLSRRPIRSFVLRQGRMSDAQTRYLTEMMPRVGIPYGQERVDLNTIFGREAPKVVEIGFGMGDATAKIARHLPGTDFVGIEVHGPGVGNLCKLIELEGIENLRIVQHDAIEVVEDMIAPDSLDGIHVFFPDPWPKKRHHKRRIIQPPLVKLLASRLKPGGYLHCATDWEEYAEQMLEVLGGEATLENTVDAYAPRPEYRPETKFEARGLRLGHGVWDLVFRRR